MKLLVVGDARKNRRMSAWGFSAEHYEVISASSRAAVEALLRRGSFHLALVDWRMRDDDAPHIAAMVHARLPDLPIVALTGPGEHISVALERCGVTARLVSPAPIEDLHAMVRALALRIPVKAARDVSHKIVDTTPSAGRLPAPPALDEVARRTLALATRAARSSAAILVLGETGTGKSLLARMIHDCSPLRARPFVTVNCPCLSHELLESELFGHVRGAFTGAVQDTIGKVAVADGGTLFLDEIGDLPTSLQPKLLRLLQEKQYERVGEATPRTADVRIIAATNRDLKSEVRAGGFREDLYYRLNVIAIEVPPLRGRPEQIMGVAESLLETFASAAGRTGTRFSPEARALLESHHWPGNLRELRNAVERAVILSSGPVLTADDFEGVRRQAPRPDCRIGGPMSLRALEAAHIQLVLENSSSLEEAARILEIDKSTLYRKRKQMEAQVAPFAAPAEKKREAMAGG